MSEKVLCEKSDLVAIADAVREATGSAENYNVSELSAATVATISAGGGGASVETCTVAVTAVSGSSEIVYTTYTESGYEVICETIPWGTTMNINNVVCNTAIVITDYSEMGPPVITANGSAELVEMLYPSSYTYIATLKCTSTANGTISIVQSGADGQNLDDQ